MPNIQDHALAVGEMSLGERPFDALDALILSQLVYLPMEGLLKKRTDRCSVAEAWEYLRKNVDIDTLDIFQKKRYRLYETCAGLARYQSWEMEGYLNEVDEEREMQFCACTYDLMNGVRCIAFRGTDLHIVGWKEDLNMAYMTVPSQHEAVEYVHRAAKENGDVLYLCGHSKGGNLGVYAGACTHPSARERIRRVYAFDGPGVDEETIHSHGYALISDRIESYLPQSSVVGMLLNYHPVYTVVRANTLGVLQHDVMTWQIRQGDFIRLEEVDMTGKVTDEAIHAWLASMDMEERRLLVDTLYQVVDASQAQLVTELVEDWRDSAARMLEAIRDLDQGVKKSVRRMLRSLFATGANEVIAGIVQSLTRREWAADEEENS